MYFLVLILFDLYQAKASDIENIILEETADEDLLDAASPSERKDNVDGRYEADEVDELVEKLILMQTYKHMKKELKVY